MRKAKKNKFLRCGCFLIFVLFVFGIRSFAEDAIRNKAQAETAAPKQEVPPVQAVVVEAPQAAPAQRSPTETLTAAENVTLDFKDADILNVLKIISFKAGINIVTTPDVIGNVTIRLVDVPWEMALNVVLRTYGFAYERQGNVIMVTKMENIAKIQQDEPLRTEIFNLKFLDAQDAEKILIPLLSNRGRISVLYTRGQKGWEFGTFRIGRETSSGNLAKEAAEAPKTETIAIEKNKDGEIISKKAEFQASIKSKTLVITDTGAVLDRIRNVILPIIDKKPKQVLIEARLMEVSVNKLRDLGVDWGVGSPTNAGTNAITMGAINSPTGALGGHGLGSNYLPSVFTPLEGTNAISGGISGMNPYNVGAEIIFQKLTGTKMEVILHALENDVHTNTLSAPRVMTLDNQEAAILVGYHTPILSSTVSAGTTTQGSTVTQTLDYYQEIGIRLNVVPQVNDEGYINMIVHPSITSSNSSVTATNTAGTDAAGNPVQTVTSYPIIDVRETQTQILMQDGETVVIGGLLKDIKAKETTGVPFLSQIPLLGGLFRRDTYNTQKVDLLIFITAHIVGEGEITQTELARLQQKFGYDITTDREVVVNLDDMKKSSNKSSNKSSKNKK